MNDGMSAIGTKRTSLVAPHMSASGGRADIAYIVRQAAWPAHAEQFARSERRLGKAAMKYRS